MDAGGVKKEFFQLLLGELVRPEFGMLVHNPESRTVYFNPDSLETDTEFMLIGIIVSLAIYNSVLLDLPLPLAVYKKLLGLPAGLPDLETMQPRLARSLRQLLDYDEAASGASVEDCFCLTFSLDVESFGEVK